MRSNLEMKFQRELIMVNIHFKSTYTWLKMEHVVLQGCALVPLLFLIYKNDLAQILREIARPVLFADDTSIKFSNSDYKEFKNNL